MATTSSEQDSRRDPTAANGAGTPTRRPTRSATPTPTPTRTPTRTGLLLAALAAPAAMGVSGASLALPDAAHELAVSPASAAWLMTAFGLGMAVGTPLLTATAGRRHGPAGVIGAGAVLVTLGAALVLLAPGLPLAVAGRVMEAAGAAGLNVAAFHIAGHDRSGRTPAWSRSAARPAAPSVCSPGPRWRGRPAGVRPWSCRC